MEFDKGQILGATVSFHLTQNPMQAPHVTYTGPSMIFTLFSIHEELPPDYRLATVQEARDNPQALLKQMPRELIANLADGSVSGASHGGSISREETWRHDLHYMLATQHPPQADPRSDSSVSNAGTGMSSYGMRSARQPRDAVESNARLRDCMLTDFRNDVGHRLATVLEIANLADGSMDGACYGGFPRRSVATPARYHLATIREVREVREVQDNREALLRAMLGWEIANLVDDSVDGAFYGGDTRMDIRNDVGHRIATLLSNRLERVEEDVVDLNYEEFH